MTRNLTMLCLSLITIGAMAQTDLKTKDYNVKAFNKIITHGGGNVEIQYSREYTVNIKDHGYCMESVNISVSSETLHIETESLPEDGSGCTIYVGVAILEELVQAGGGNIIIKGGSAPPICLYAKSEPEDMSMHRKCQLFFSTPQSRAAELSC